MKMVGSKSQALLAFLLLCFGHIEAKEPIKTLTVTIQAGDDFLDGIADIPEAIKLPAFIKDESGVANALSGCVWLDIGPLAIKLGNDFERSKAQTISIPLQNLPPLFVEDISCLGLEKKGVLGFTNAPDNFLDFSPTLLIGLPDDIPLVTPDGSLQHYLQVFHQRVDLVKYLAQQSRDLIDAQQKVVDAQTHVLNEVNDHIADVQKRIAGLTNELADVYARAANVEQKLLTLERQLVNTPKTIIQKIIKFLPWPLDQIVDIVTKPNQVFLDLQSKANDARLELERIRSEATVAAGHLSADIQTLNVELQASMQKRLISLTTKVEAEAAIQAQKIALTEFNKTLQVVSDASTKLDKAAALLPTAPLPDFPKPGQFKPILVQVTVNGTHTIGPFNPNVRLGRNHSSWKRYLSNDTALRRVARNLRIQPEHEGGGIEQEISRYTTVFKNLGISGWKDYPQLPLQSAEVDGTLVHRPSPGQDKYVSLDLRVEQLSDGQQSIEFDANGGFFQDRFIRIEYQHVSANGSDDTRYKQWSIGDRLKVKGRLRWDTDRGGFYEIHPGGSSDISKVSAPEAGPSPATRHRVEAFIGRWKWGASGSRTFWVSVRPDGTLESTIVKYESDGSTTTKIDDTGVWTADATTGEYTVFWKQRHSSQVMSIAADGNHLLEKVGDRESIRGTREQ
jgi:hypothetical protein